MTVVGGNSDGSVVVHDMPTGHGGNVDMTPTLPVDMVNGDGHICSSTSSSCPGNGVMCGTTCCYEGEWCDTAKLSCNCGNNGPCPSAQYLCTSLTGPPHPTSTCGDTCSPTL